MAAPPTLNLSEYLLARRLEAGDGERRAILTEQDALTYGQVDALASAYAWVLRENGLAVGERVLLALPDGADYVGALLGILRAGGVAVMVNPELPPDEIAWLYGYTEATHAFIHAAATAAASDAAAARAAASDAAAGSDSAASATAASDAAAESAARDATAAGDAAAATTTADAFHEAARSAPASPRLLDVGSDDLRTLLSQALGETATPHPSRPDDPAIWLFSGGTTGRPKGVVQTHRSFVNTTELYGQGVLGLTRDDVTLSVPKLYFGYATGSNLFFPLSVGATSALFPERCTPETLFAKIERFRPTVLVNVPTMVNKLLAHPGAAERDLSSLRLSTSAGEALPPELHRRWTDTWGVPLLDGLGTAEMWHIFISNRVDDVRPGTLGKVVPGFTVKACDDEGREVPRGEVGTMRVKGDSLALGYWKHPEKTARAFRDGWYVSGDMIRVDDEGWVTYCGRADDMLKVSGKWFSPGELENCLLQHEAVREVAVVGVASAEGLTRPRACVVPTEDARADDALAAELQAWAKERLQPYKYPREVVFMEELPRTHLGKVDRGRLTRA